MQGTQQGASARPGVLSGKGNKALHKHVLFAISPYVQCMAAA